MSPLFRYLASAAVLVSAALITFPSAGKSDFEANVLPHFLSYQKCAHDHFYEIGTLPDNDRRSFEDVEISVVAVCGHHIDLARDKMAKMGYDRSTQKEIIKIAYEEMQPRLAATFKRGKRAKLVIRETKRHQIAWESCLVQFTAKVVDDNPEFAGTIIRGAFAACHSDGDAFLNGLMNGVEDGVAGGEAWRDFVLETLYPTIKRNLEDKLTALILLSRATPEQSAPPAASGRSY